MKMAKQKLILPGFVWLATATALPALAQNPSPRESRQSLSEPSALPSADGPASPVADFEAAPPVYYETDCPPRRLGPYGRWRQRCRAHAQDKCCGYPEEFQDAPLGASSQSYVSLSVARGQAARMILHQFDFIPASHQLKPRGKVQAAKIAGWASMNPYPIFVEPSGNDPELDEARRQSVWRELAGGLSPIPIERVVVGYAASHGLSGPESQAIDLNRLGLTVSRGVGAGGAGGGAGGLAGGAGGAAATVAR